jgi:L-lactate dehydrogenase (cytochrome)/(S)-mandelate dehydrogenase
MAGTLDRLHSIADLRAMARRRVPKSVFEFIDGGAGDELTLADNRAGFDRLRIVPRILTDVSNPDLSSVFLGQRLAAPLVIAPMGSCMLVHPDADIAIARAATARGLPYTLSTMATTSLETMARRVDGPLWFQLYVLKDLDFNEKLIRRARENGYSTLIITVDLQAGGKREKDLANGISIPLRPSLKHLREGMMRPGWTYRLLLGGMPQFENVRGYLGDKSAGLTIAARVGANLHAGFDWAYFSRLRDLWPGSLVVKGVNHPDDARELIRRGADALWVSNHGGRQLDGAIASIDALAGIRAAVGPSVDLMIDSGIRRGTDLIKAKALGAGAGAIGRAVLYGASAGEAGARRAIDILLEELKLGLKLAGQPRFADVDAGLLA